MKIETGFEMLNEDIRNFNIRNPIIKGASVLDNTGFNYYKHLSPKNN